jgi:hypothetical protein
MRGAVLAFVVAGLVGLGLLKSVLGHDIQAATGRHVFYLAGLGEIAIALMVFGRRTRRIGLLCGTCFFGLLMVLAGSLRMRRCGCFGRGLELGWQFEVLVAGCFGAACAWLLLDMGIRPRCREVDAISGE